MNHAPRRPAITGAALLGAGLFAAAPAVAPAPATTDIRDVSLTAVDVTWDQVLATATANAQTVLDATAQAYGALFNGLGAAIANGTFFDHLPAALQAAPLIGAPDELALAVVPHTLGGTGDAFPTPESVEQPDDAGHEVHLLLYQGLIGADPDEYQPPEAFAGLLTPLVNVVSSPLSGVLLGWISPAVSPWVALLNGLDDPAMTPDRLILSVVDGLLNGAVLNGDTLVPALDELLLSGDETERLTGLSYGFGGLFSPGMVVTGVGGENNGVGGSALNAVGMKMDVDEPQIPELGQDGGGFIGHTDLFANGIGPFAGFAGLADIIGHIFAGDLAADSAG